MLRYLAIFILQQLVQDIPVVDGKIQPINKALYCGIMGQCPVHDIPIWEILVQMCKAEVRNSYDFCF